MFFLRVYGSIKLIFYPSIRILLSNVQCIIYNKVIKILDFPDPDLPIIPIFYRGRIKNEMDSKVKFF